MKLEDFIKRADELIVAGEATLKTKRTSGQFTFFDTTQFRSFRSSSLSFLFKTFGKDHPFYIEFSEHVTSTSQHHIEAGLGVLRGARDEVAGGWTISAKAIVSAEIFSDFLGMASYLLTEGYKDAAAVIIGSTLEERLRQLCHKAGVPIETTKPSGEVMSRKADTLNADLAKQGVYGVLDQKSMTTWLDLRNKAAHGKYSEYTKEQVELMYQGVLDFMARIPV